MDNHINIPMIISFFFSFLLLIVTFYPQLSHSLPPQLPQALNSYSTCKEQSYNCGNITNVFYPFSLEKSYFERDELVRGLDKGFEVNYSVSGECLACLGNQEDDCRFKIVNDFESSCYYCPWIPCFFNTLFFSS